MLQLMTIYNAIRLGWKVEIVNRKLILKKKIKDMTYLDNNTSKLLAILMNLNGKNESIRY